MLGLGPAKPITGQTFTSRADPVLDIGSDHRPPRYFRGPIRGFDGPIPGPANMLDPY